MGTDVSGACDDFHQAKRTRPVDSSSQENTPARCERFGLQDYAKSESTCVVAVLLPSAAPKRLDSGGVQAYWRELSIGRFAAWVILPIGRRPKGISARVPDGANIAATACW